MLWPGTHLTDSLSPSPAPLPPDFRRRERVCAVLTELGASCTATYWAHRDWALHSLDGIADEAAASAELAATVAAISGYLANVRLLISCPSSAAEEASLACMRSLSSLAVCNERLGARAGYKLGGEGGMSRLAQYVRMLVVSTLSLKDVRIYAGTPHVMRYFVTIMNYGSPVLLAPYWRSFCEAEDARGTPHDGRDNCPGGYFSASLYCIIISSLYMVTRGVEDVLDGFGLDDVRFDQDVHFAEIVALDNKTAVLCGDEVGVEVNLNGAELRHLNSHR